MIDPADTPEDAALRRLYRQERPEPDARLDDAILHAAREAVAEQPSSRVPPRRKWRYPVGVGAAASALLAVLIFQQPSETVEELERIKASPASDLQHLPSSKTMNSAERQPAAEAVGALAPSAAPAELARQAVKEMDAGDAAVAFRATGAAPMRMREESAADSAVSSDSSCGAESTTLASDGLMLCITDELIEAHDLAMGCVEPLSLSRSVAGAVSIEREAQSVTISIGGDPYWRVQCRDANWRVDALR